MAYDHRLAARIRGVFGHRKGVEEKRMFGGLAFLVGGHMACGIVGEELMVRVGPRAYEAALAEPHVREMDFTGKPLRGMVYVGVDGIAAEDDLARWVERGHDYAASLPPKTA
jgi:TfoX/Sxy family transcriptional regulator of competence genes